ncbi:glycoside hydrolase family 3 protein [Marinitoga sp. 38H-ov]|uniref:glycoside hydrolase family 3 protein n=1 Tax=Marinitoga sp. 38H-ov TaxID=1755814 RepID=UPI0013EC9418|nr:glycoside hydrolase family 3 protein [Marinitoga sp. 38H-ov]KAF2956136.1 hypothetical protein AS160_07140 [Marinitoga sp. 38H-ov]
MNNYGKLFFLGFPDGLDDEALNIIKDYEPAGVILYPDNMKSIEELQISMDKLYSLNIPLLISSDHEGGQLETVPGILSSPGNYAIGKNDINSAYDYAKYLGKKLREYGFNMVFSPVLDVLHEDSSAVTGLRVFSNNVETITEFGKYYIKGLKEHNILPTPKHFPGHGKAKQDSHEETPIIFDFSFDDDDIFPFKTLINEIEILMTAHVIYKPLDNELGTVSKVILDELLRKKLNYKGIVISDAIEMKAFYNNYFPEKIDMFFNNGGDILLISDARKNFYPAYNALIESKINKNILDNKIYRIIELQKKYFNNEYEGKFLIDIAKNSLKIHIKKNIDNPDIILIPEAINLSQADTTANDLEKLENLVKLEFKKSKIIKYNPLNGVLSEKFDPNLKIISFVLDSFRFPKQLNMHKGLKNAIYVIIRNDQDEKYYNDCSYIITYSTKLISIYQAIKAIKKGV